MKLGLLTARFGSDDWPLAKIIAWAGANGYDCLEVAVPGHLDPAGLLADGPEAVKRQLADAGVTINCFGSAIANWATEITTDFNDTIEQVKRAIPRMQKLNTKLIRIMSYARIQGNEPDHEDY